MWRSEINKYIEKSASSWLLTRRYQVSFLGVNRQGHDVTYPSNTRVGYGYSYTSSNTLSTCFPCNQHTLYHFIRNLPLHGVIYFCSMKSEFYLCRIVIYSYNKGHTDLASITSMKNTICCEYSINTPDDGQ